ncbi:hypothetical protein FQZ97_494580 [compost metagenome]
MMPNTSPKSSFTRGGSTPGGSRGAWSLTRRRSSSQTCGNWWAMNSGRMSTVIWDSPALEIDVRISTWGSCWIALSRG